MEVGFAEDEQRRFRRCLLKLQSLVPATDETFKTDVNNTLDTLNTINYSHCSIPDDDVNETLCRLCVLVSLEYDLLVAKICQFVVFVTHQKNTLTTHTVEMLVEYIIAATRSSQDWMKHDVLRALGSILYENGPKCSKFLDEFLCNQPKGLLLTLLESPDDETKRLALHCIGNLCMQDCDSNMIGEEYLKQTLGILLQVLQTPKQPTTDDIEYCRILYSALRGIQVLLSSNKTIQLKLLGDILAATKVYMLFGLPGLNVVVPSTLYPSSLFQSEPTPPSIPAGSQQKKDESKDGISLRPGGGGGSKTRSSLISQSGKKTKKRSRSKHEKESSLASSSENTSNEGQQNASSTRSNMHASFNADATSSSSPASLMPIWSRVSSSESEYSDTEGGQCSRLRSMMSKVRQTSLICLQSVMKNTEKRIVFGYWSAFIPDSPPRPGTTSHTLFTSILKDSSPKARVGSVVVLSAMLEGSRQFLAAADDSENRRAAFTSFSNILAMSIKEIHRSLLLALVAETSSMSITQIIKCLSILVKNVPYHKLKEGLLTRIMRNIRPFFTNRDNNIRTACLTCLGAIIAASNSPLNEVTRLLQAKEMPMSAGSGSIPNMAASIRTPAVDTVLPQTDKAGSSPEINTPSPSPGTVTVPNELQSTDTLLDANGKPACQPTKDLPWVINFCSSIIVPSQTIEGASSLNRLQLITSSVAGEVLPVKLEALQVLVQLAKNYFSVVRPVLESVTNIIVICIEDEDHAMQLHGLKVLEELGKALLYQLNPDCAVGVHCYTLHAPIDVQEVVTLWIRLLHGPLPIILQHPRTLVLQAFACDCLSTIGPQAFLQLPMDKRILCVTLLLGLSNDEDHRVKASAIRSLGVYILYPCLREDVMFVADSANAILSAMEASYINVRMKAAWSLGNLSDALIVNKHDVDSTFIEEFSDLLLQRLFEAAIKGSADHDKVKSNAVRGLGNLIRFTSSQTLAKGNFSSLVSRAIYALIKNIKSGSMKVRWNACYAISNAFKNPHLQLGSASWTSDVYSAITTIIIACKNFKVRINGALALCSPLTRECYGNRQQFVDILTSVLKGLEMSDKIEDASELKYRETLTQQLCQTLCHLCSLLQADDLEALGQVWEAYAATLHSFMCKYKQAVHGNDLKGVVLYRTRDHLKGLSEGIPANSSCQSLLKWLVTEFSDDEDDVLKHMEVLRCSDKGC